MPTEINTLALAIDARRARDGMREYQHAADGVIRSSDGIAGSIKSMVAAFASVEAARRTAQTLIEYDKGMTGVSKTTDLTGKSLERLNERFIQLSTSVDLGASVDQMQAVAETAGQLGVSGVKNLEAFTTAFLKLEGASNIQGQEGATNLARFIGVSPETIQQTEKVASVIARLGNTFKTTEAEILDTGLAVAKNLITFKVAGSDSLAFASALSEVGESAELGGSAVGRLFRALDAATRQGGQALEELANVTNMTSREFQEQFETNNVRAVQTYLASLGEMVERKEDVVTSMKRVGLSGEELLKVIPTLASKSDVLTQAIKDANDEFRTGEALQREHERATSTLEARLGRLGNTFTAVQLSTRKYRGELGELIDGTTETVKLLAGMESGTGGFSDSVRIAATAVTALTSAGVGLVGVGLVRYLFGAAGGVNALTAAMARNPIGVFAVAASTAAGQILLMHNRMSDSAQESLAYARRLDDVARSVDQLGDAHKRMAVAVELGDVAMQAAAQRRILEDTVSAQIDATKHGMRIEDLPGMFDKRTVEQITRAATDIAIVEDRRRLAAFEKEIDELRGKAQSGLGQIEDPRLTQLIDKADMLRDKLAGPRDVFQPDVARIRDIEGPFAQLIDQQKTKLQLLESKLDSVRTKSMNVKRSLESITGFASSAGQLGTDPLQPFGPPLPPKPLPYVQEYPQQLPMPEHKVRDFNPAHYEPFIPDVPEGPPPGIIGPMPAKEITQHLEQVAASYSALEGASSRAIESMIFDGASLRDSMKALVNDLSRTILRSGISSMFNAGGTGSINSMFQGFMGNIFGGSVASANGNTFNRGGVVTTPRAVPLSVMGEAGPEAVVPLTRGRDGRLGIQSQGGGGQTINVNIHVDAGTTNPDGFRRSARQIANQVQRAVSNQ